MSESEGSIAAVAGKSGAKGKRSRLNRSQRQSLVSFAYAAPQLVLYSALLLLPFFVAIPIMFTDQLDFLDTGIEFVGFQNFVTLFQAPMIDKIIPALRRTIIFTATSYLMVYLFGFLLALAMFEVTSRLKGAFFAIIYLPWMVSGVGLGLLLIMLFSRETGTVNLAIEAAGGPDRVFDAKTEAAAVYALPFIYGWKTAGFNMAIFLGGLLAIPKEVIESAKIDGAKYVQRVMHVYIPMIVPSIITVSIFALVNGFGIFDELVGLGGLAGNSNARFFSVLIYELGFASSDNYGAKIGTLAQGLTLSLVVFAPLVLIAFYLNRLQRRLQYT